MPFELTGNEYAELVDELEFEGTQIGAFSWGTYEDNEPPDSVTTLEDYLEWRGSLPDGPQPSPAALAEQLRRAQEAVDEAGDDPSRSTPLRLALWDAQSRVVCALRDLWQSYPMDVVQQRLGARTFGPTIAVADAQRALWFATKAADAVRIARHQAALAEAQQRLTAFLSEFGPGGTSWLAFDNVKPVDEPFKRRGLPRSLWPGRPLLGGFLHSAPQNSKQHDVPEGALLSLSVTYGSVAEDWAVVRTTRAWSTSSKQPRLDRWAIQDLAVAATGQFVRGEMRDLAPNVTRELLDEIERETKSSPETWTVDGESVEGTRYETRSAYAVILGLPDVMLIVSGTPPLRGRELITLTDLSAYES